MKSARYGLSQRGNITELGVEIRNSVAANRLNSFFKKNIKYGIMSGQLKRISVKNIICQLQALRDIAEILELRTVEPKQIVKTISELKEQNK